MLIAITATTSTDHDERWSRNAIANFQDAARNPNVRPTCASCGMPGHATASPPHCPNNPLRKDEFLRRRIPQHKTFTRVRSYNAAVRPEYRCILLQRVNEASDYLRQVMTRLQLFMNDFALHHPFDLTQHLFSHQGLYNVTKLIRQRPFPPRQGMPASIQQHWNVFTGSLNGDIYIVQGFSAQLTVTCKAQAACNKTHCQKL